MAGNQTNVEYWFRLVYDCFHGACYGSMADVSAFLAHLWTWIVIIGYALSIIGLFVIIYATIRLFELRKREEEFYNSIIEPEEEGKGMHPRWEHIQTLMEGSTTSEWKEAIIEADIMLDDVLTKKGYAGNGVGEKLKSISEDELASIQDAWEAHKVRNLVAHQGSTYDLSETTAGRTIARYEAVFRELKVI